MRSFADAIGGVIPGGVSVMDFAISAGTDHVTARRTLEEMMQNGIGRMDGESFDFSAGDRLKAAILALQRGAGIDEVAEKIGWRDFEGLVGEILESKDFAVMKNFMLKKPRMEIDVIGVKTGVAMLIDCKHWKRLAPSALYTMVKKQVERTVRYVASTEGALAIPVIVTLYQDRTDFVEKVPVVPITKFASFVDEFYGNLDGMRQIRA